MANKRLSMKEEKIRKVTEIIENTDWVQDMEITITACREEAPTIFYRITERIVPKENDNEEV